MAVKPKNGTKKPTVAQQRRFLQGLYANPKIERVAYLDESIVQAETSASKTARARNPRIPPVKIPVSYVLTAVVYDVVRLPQVRADLIAAANLHRKTPREHWHTTDTVSDPGSEGGSQPVLDFLSGVAATKPAMLYALTTSLAPNQTVDTERWREQSLEQITRMLSQPGGPNLMVLDYNSAQPHLNQQDQRVIRSVNPLLQVTHASMAAEPAMWATDAVAWAVQAHQRAAMGEQRYNFGYLKRIEQLMIRIGISYDTGSGTVYAVEIPLETPEGNRVNQVVRDPTLGNVRQVAQAHQLWQQRWQAAQLLDPEHGEK